MADYELMLVLPPQVATNDKVLEKVQKVITSTGGTISKIQSLGKKPLAYPIDKQTEGIYQLIEFEAPTETLGNLDSKLKIEEQLLRFLILAKGD